MFLFLYRFFSFLALLALSSSISSIGGIPATTSSVSVDVVRYPAETFKAIFLCSLLNLSAFLSISVTFPQIVAAYHTIEYATLMSSFLIEALGSPILG
ncbi:hypothetical protein Zmor_002933 [Zophobas morio]|uniref:Uncharacterized protein n=1 Tax=Zophobas morio TaxID=2755281 RepID=A0AA38HMR9_9CUCU|nr:hypothetical protein Zmor_002933 [Zophobas morio]